MLTIMITVVHTILVILNTIVFVLFLKRKQLCQPIKYFLMNRDPVGLGVTLLEGGLTAKTNAGRDVNQT